MRFQKYPGTCGRGLSSLPREEALKIPRNKLEMTKFLYKNWVISQTISFPGMTESTDIPDW